MALPSEFCLWSSDTGLLLLAFTKELQLLEHHAEKDELRCICQGLKTQLVSPPRGEGVSEQQPGTHWESPRCYRVETLFEAVTPEAAPRLNQDENNLLSDLEAYL